jgi:enoyl-CoA hydratase/carnithine racemase
MRIIDIIKSETKNSRGGSMTTFDVENSVFYSSRVNDTVIFKYKENAFSLLKDVAVRDEFMKLIEATDESREIKGIVIINDTAFDDEAGMQAFIELLRSIANSPGSGLYLDDTIAKFYIAYGRRMLLSISMTKPQVAGIHGDVTGEYLGFTLLYDSRFATPDTRIKFNNASFGLPVGPGLSHFLPRFIGQGKALDFIHHSKVLTAEEALSLGLITDIVPHEQLQARCQQEVEMLSKQPANVAVANRMLFNPDASESEHQLKRYYDAIVQAVHKL